MEEDKALYARLEALQWLPFSVLLQNAQTTLRQNLFCLWKVLEDSACVSSATAEKVFLGE